MVIKVDILETSYRNDFVKKGNAVCPAKVLLETVGKGIFNERKDKFDEKSAFKAMNPNFQAIATGKFSFVQP